MKQSRFISRIKAQIPNIKETGVTDQEIMAYVNEGVDQANLFMKVYQTHTDFNVTAEKQIYSLAEIAPTYLGMVKKRAYFLDANSAWQPILPKTLDWIAKIYRQFLNVTSTSLPQWYWIEGDDLGFYPPPSITQASGGRLYHLKKATPMGNDDHYPWTGTTVELTALLPADDAIIAYVRWKLSPAIGSVTDADLRYAEFIKECRRAAMQIKRRPDMTFDQEYRIRI